MKVRYPKDNEIWFAEFQCPLEGCDCNYFLFKVIEVKGPLYHYKLRGEAYHHTSETTYSGGGRMLRHDWADYYREGRLEYIGEL